MRFGGPSDAAGIIIGAGAWVCAGVLCSFLMSSLFNIEISSVDNIDCRIEPAFICTSDSLGGLGMAASGTSLIKPVSSRLAGNDGTSGLAPGDFIALSWEIS